MKLFETSVIQLQELWAIEPVLLEYARASDPLIVAMVDDQPTCFVGFIPMLGIFGIPEAGYIWMETLPLTAKHKIATARHAKDLIRKALQRWPAIRGHCNTPDSIRWMKSLGAEFYPTIPPSFEIRR